jgi:hypothetical protein
MGLGDFLFGSSGYKPDEENLRKQEQSLNDIASANLKGTTTTTRKKKEGTGQYVGSSCGGLSWVPEQYEDVQEFKPDKLQLDYTPGSSGYKLTGQDSMLGKYSQYKPTDYQAPTLMNQAEQYYGELGNQAQQNILASTQAGLDMAQATAGRRGLASSGINRQAQGNLLDTMSRQIQEARTNIGFQRARDYNDISQRQAELDYRMATFKEDQERYKLGLESERRAKTLQEIITENQLDASRRAEKSLEYWTPYDKQAGLYQTGLAVASKDEPGLLSQIGDVASGVGQAMTGVANLKKG